MVKPIDKTLPIISQELAPKPLFNSKTQKKVLLGVQLSSIVRYLTNTVCSGVESLKNFRYGDPLKVILPVRLPISILCIINAVRGIKESSTNEKVDGALSVVSEVGNIADIVATSVDGFASIGVATVKVAMWTTPLFLVGLSLQAAGLVLTMKNLIETHKFSKLFGKSAAVKEKVENYALNHFSKGVDLITDRSTSEKRFVTKHFGVNNEKLCARLNKIKGKAESVFNSNNEVKKLEYRSKMKNVIVLLDKRMMTLKKSRAFTIVATLVGVVGIAVLMTTPAAPVGFILLGVSATLELAHYFKMRSMTKQFKADMKLKAV